MLSAAPQRTTRRIALSLAAILAALGLLTLAAPLAQAAPSGWGRSARRAPQYPDLTSGRGFPAATFVSNSVGGGVGVQSGSSTCLQRGHRRRGEVRVERARVT